MKRRTYLSTIGATMTIVSGCQSEVSAIDNATNSKTTNSNQTNGLKLIIKNKIENKITAEVRITPDDTSKEPILDKKYELDATSTRKVSLDAAPTEYVVSASMPDGPVESIFEHQWKAKTESTLTITFSNDGVDFS